MRLLFVKDFLDLIFPRNCELCGRNLIDAETCLCTHCQGKLPITNYHLRSWDNDLKSKIEGLTQVGQVMAFLNFSKSGKSQEILHKLKYRNKPEIGRYLGNLYGKLLINSDFYFNWNAIVAVPLHEMKRVRRGYNQSEEFARGLSEVLNIPVVQSLKRVVSTETQTKKSRLQRLENVENVFVVENPDYIKGKNILLVDDVMTTGATLCSCANVLLASHAKNVDLACIAAGGKI